jgi:hypothetical protein
MVVTLSDDIIKRLISRATRGDEQAPGTMSAPLWHRTVRAEVSHSPTAGVIDVMLLGHVGVVDCGNVCGLLAGCLQDVRFTVLRILTFVVLLLTLACF